MTALPIAQTGTITRRTRVVELAAGTELPLASLLATLPASLLAPFVALLTILITSRCSNVPVAILAPGEQENSRNDRYLKPSITVAFYSDV